MQTLILIKRSIFRGQSLRYTLYNYCSEGFFGDAFDGATDDAIALLNVALELYPQADSSRVAAFGGSRRGTVSLLLVIRDERIKRVIAQAAPTDFFTRKASKRYAWQYKYQFLSKPESLATIRKKIIKSSPIHFAEFLPDIWVDHGEKDPIVSLDQFKDLRDTLSKRGHTDFSKMNSFPNKGHQLGLNNEHISLAIGMAAPWSIKTT